MMEQPAPRRRIDRVVSIVVGVLIIGCGIAVWQRNSIRAWLWARGLRNAQTADERTYYVTMLAALREKSVSAATGLLEDPRAEVRELAVGILVHGGSKEAQAALIGALHDTDQDVRDSAAHSLAFANAPDALGPLATAIWDQRGETAMAMCVAVGRMDSPAALDALAELAARHSDVNVRAQAVELLGMHAGSRAERALRPLLEDESTYAATLYGERLSAAAEAQAAYKTSALAASSAQQRVIGKLAERSLAHVMKPPATQEIELPELP